MDVGGLFDSLGSAGPIVFWMVVLFLAFSAFLLLAWVVSRWPLLLWAGVFAVIAYYGRAPWVTAALLAVIAFLLWGLIEETDHTRERQETTNGLLARLVKAVDDLKYAVESLDPEVKHEREVNRARYERWTREKAQQEAEEARRPFVEAEAEVVGTAPEPKPPKGPGPGDTYAERFIRWVARAMSGLRRKKPTE